MITAYDCSTVDSHILSITDFKNQLIDVKDKFQNLTPTDKTEAFLLIQDLQSSLSLEENNCEKTPIINDKNPTSKTTTTGSVEKFNLTHYLKINNGDCEEISETKAEELVFSLQHKGDFISTNCSKVNKRQILLRSEKSMGNSLCKSDKLPLDETNQKIFSVSPEYLKRKSCGKSFGEHCGTILLLNNKTGHMLKTIESNEKGFNPTKTDNTMTKKLSHYSFTKRKHKKVHRKEADIKVTHKNVTGKRITPKLKIKLSSGDNKKEGKPSEEQQDVSIVENQCVQCSLVFASKKELTNHNVTVHNLPPASSKNIRVPVREIFEKTDLPSSLMSSQSNLFKCSVCKKKFSTDEILNNHVLSANHINKKGMDSSKKKLYSCSICDSQFVYKQGLTRHNYERHSDTEPYKCRGCDYVSRSKANLKRHMELHLNDRRYICEICGTSFNAHATLKSHLIYVHSEERKLNCNVCGKSFKVPSALNRHFRIHKDERPYVCFCKEAYKRMSHLKRHIHSVHKQKVKGNRVEKVSNNIKKLARNDTSISDSLTKKKSRNMEKEGPNLESVCSSINNTQQYQHLASREDCQLVTEELPILIQNSLRLPDTEIQLTTLEELSSHSIPFQIVTKDGTLLTVQYNTLQANHHSQAIAYQTVPVNCSPEQIIASNKINSKGNQISELCIPESTVPIWETNHLVNNESSESLVNNHPHNQLAVNLIDGNLPVSSVCSSLKHLTFPQISTNSLKSVIPSDTFNPDSNVLSSSDLHPLSDQFYCESVNLNSLLSV